MFAFLVLGVSFFTTRQENGSEERLNSDILCRVGLKNLSSVSDIHWFIAERVTMRLMVMYFRSSSSEQ